MNKSLSRPVRVGLIGGGGVASAHIAGYREHSDVISLDAISEVDPALARSRADEMSVPAFDDYREMLRVAVIDAVDICLPHHLHAAAIIAAADAGKHILCEKPLCTSASELDAIASAIEASGVTMMCAHNQVFKPSIRKARELIDAGAIGDIYQAHATCNFRLGIDATTVGWRGRTASSGGGELIDSGYHPVYTLLHLIDGNPKEVTAVMSRHRLDFLEGEDSAYLIARFENGAIGQITTSWAYELVEGAESVTVAGSLGSLRATESALTYKNITGDVQTFEFSDVNTFAAEIRHFAESIASGTRPIQTHEDGRRTLELILAAYKSAAAKRMVELSSPRIERQAAGWGANVA